MYGLDPKEYDKLLNNIVTKSYMKSNIKTVNEINKEANVLTEKLKINDRVQCFAQNEAFITIKDHKPSFPKNLACRLLNHCKSQICKGSKVYLENINNSIRNSTNLNQSGNQKLSLIGLKRYHSRKNPILLSLALSVFIRVLVRMF